jgi:hypothetical protein
MYHRNKSLTIESIAVMLVLMLLAFLVVVVVRSGSAAYNNIIKDKENTESARVAYSYINMKIKQNDSASLISVEKTGYGNSLKIESQDKAYSTYIFFSDGELYECLTENGPPSVEAANKITTLSAFDISLEGKYVKVTCVSISGDKTKSVEGTVSLRT